MKLNIIKRFVLKYRALFLCNKNVGGDVNNGEKNLVPLSERTKDEQREICQKGGKKSGETRRRKKAMREAMKDLLSMPVMNTEIYNATALMGVEPENIDNQAAILCSLILNAQTGNVLAAKEIRSIIGEDNESRRTDLLEKEYSDKNKSNKNGAVVIEIAPRGSRNEN